MSAYVFTGVSTNDEILNVSRRIFDLVRTSTLRAAEVLDGKQGTVLPQGRRIVLASGQDSVLPSLEENIHTLLRTLKTRSPQNYRTLSVKLNSPAISLTGTTRRTGNVTLDFSNARSISDQALEAGYFSPLQFSRTTVANVRVDPAHRKLVFNGTATQYASMIKDAVAWKNELNVGTTAVPVPPHRLQQPGNCV